MAISRMEHGYQVRVMRQGRLYSRFFKRKRDAQKFERDLKRVLGPPTSQKGWIRGPRKTTTGIPRIVERTFRRKGRTPVEVFIVYWRTPDGKPRYSTVSIRKHGREKALRLAKRIKREKDAAWLNGTKSKRVSNTRAVVSNPAGKRKRAGKQAGLARRRKPRRA